MQLLDKHPIVFVKPIKNKYFIIIIITALSQYTTKALSQYKKHIIGDFVKFYYLFDLIN